MEDKCGYCDTGDITCPFCKTNYGIYKWTSVEDRLPEKNEFVLAHFKERLSPTALNVTITKRESLRDQSMASDFSHWMPLPEPPRSE